MTVFLIQKDEYAKASQKAVCDIILEMVKDGLIEFEQDYNSRPLYLAQKARLFKNIRLPIAAKILNNGIVELNELRFRDSVISVNDSVRQTNKWMRIYTAIIAFAAILSLATTLIQLCMHLDERSKPPLLIIKQTNGLNQSKNKDSIFLFQP